jgi:hypothetical protein
MPSDELSATQQNSITLKRNAKGDYAWDIKVYFAPENSVNALEGIKEIDANLRQDYLGGN